LALFVFRSSVGNDLFTWIAKFAEGYLHNAFYGAQFVFGDTAANAGTFALSVFPAIIFFASTVQMLYYVGAIPWVLKKMSVVCMAVLQISGAESIVAIASVSSNSQLSYRLFSYIHCFTYSLSLDKVRMHF
jgi:CNT family concentrative nucleoside transporter